MGVRNGVGINANVSIHVWEYVCECVCVSHITRHTSHITHHTSHMTRYLVSSRLVRLEFTHSDPGLPRASARQKELGELVQRDVPVAIDVVVTHQFFHLWRCEGWEGEAYRGVLEGWYRRGVAGRWHLFDGDAVGEVADGVCKFLGVQETRPVVVVEGEGTLLSVGGWVGGKELVS